jgi:hypothetical protein
VNTVLRLEVELLPTADGGRRRPAPDGYRASMWFGRVRRKQGWDPILQDAVLVFEDADSLAPGARATARAWVIEPEDLPRDLAPERAFALVEGERTVARARLLEILDDPAPSPLSDLAAAKARPLVPVPAED